MKTKLLFALGLMSNMFSNTFAQTDSHGYTTVKASMGASYQNTVFFDLSTNKLTSQPANTWDVAFYRNGAMSFSSIFAVTITSFSFFTVSFTVK